MAYSDEVKTAQEVLEEEGAGDAKWTALQEEARQRAETANVTRSEYVNYADKFAAYESRDDVETLADRRARENGENAAAADHVRSSTDANVARTDGIYRSPRG